LIIWIKCAVDEFDVPKKGLNFTVVSVVDKITLKEWRNVVYFTALVQRDEG
jgi:hypothetical protein